MTKVEVKGQTWDVASVDGNTVTLVGGQQIEVSDNTLAVVKAGLTVPARVRRKLSTAD